MLTMDTSSIFEIKTAATFKAKALALFAYQFEHNPVYRSFCDLLHKHPSEIDCLTEIPFLPIQFFKSHKVLCSQKPIVQTFKSSGTTGSIQSKHHVVDLSLYEKSFSLGFQLKYGAVEDFVVFALLPSYLEREGSSLVYMAQAMITKSKHSESGFYLNDLERLKNSILAAEEKGKKILLLGVSYALLDLVERYTFTLQNTIVMETGGMKGRRKEMIRAELHQILKNGFGVSKIHSEYGMTELLSQAYSDGDGLFETPPWMRVFIRNPKDAMEVMEKEASGAINIIDLANVNSCAFLATEDLGKRYDNGKFSVQGRFDAAAVRGCNLMVV